MLPQAKTFHSWELVDKGFCGRFFSRHQASEKISGEEIQAATRNV
jgi:hypothetical protein